MHIKLTKYKENRWRADIQDLPGIPPIGEGKDELEAVCVLFTRILQQNNLWSKFINPNCLTIEKKESIKL